MCPQPDTLRQYSRSQRARTAQRGDNLRSEPWMSTYRTPLRICQWCTFQFVLRDSPLKTLLLCRARCNAFSLRPCLSQIAMYRSPEGVREVLAGSRRSLSSSRSVRECDLEVCKHTADVFIDKTHAFKRVWICLLYSPTTADDFFLYECHAVLARIDPTCPLQTPALRQ
jgi:hypothetical protein